MSLLELNYEQGRLQLVNLQNKDQALKLGWLFRNRKYIQVHIKAYIPEELGQHFWECNLNEKDATNLPMTRENSFWSNLIILWFKYTWKQTHNGDDQCTTNKKMILWYNSLIRVNNQPLFYKKAAKASIIYVEHMFDKANKILSFERIIEKYGNCMNWYQYAQIYSVLYKDKNAMVDKEEKVDLFQEVQKSSK